MHRLVVLVEAGPGVAGRCELIRREPTLAAAVVAAVRQAEAQGARVAGVLGNRDEVLVAADLVVRLRRVARQLSEEDLFLLLELLPL